MGTTQYCPDLTDKPLIILTSDYSASGAELFSADARDLGFGIAIGQTTFGKGIAQMIYNSSCLLYTSGGSVRRRHLRHDARLPGL